MYHGDIRLGDTIDIKFCTTAAATGAPTTLSGTPVISAYPGNSTTQLTAGITLSVDFDSVTGLNNVRVVATSGNGYATATNYVLVVTTGTVGGTSAVGYCIGSFSIENRSAVMPTTAARTLTVDASGRALSDVDTIKTNPVVNAGTVTFPTTATLASTTNITAGTITTTTNLTNLPSIPANWITAAGITAAALNGKGDWNIGKTGYALTATTGLGNQTSNITGNLSGSVGSVTGAVGSVTGNVGGNVTGSVGSVTGLTNATIADQVWDEALAGHVGAGSTGAALNAAGAAGDPWTIALPGAYGAGTAGFIVGTNLDATVSSVKAKTDNLPAAPAAVGDIPTAVENADALLGRNVAGGSSAGRTVKEALYVLRNKTDIAGGTLTVYGTDDSTPAFTAGVTTSAGDPISAIDPA